MRCNGALSCSVSRDGIPFFGVCRWHGKSNLVLTLRQLQRTAALVFPQEVVNNGEIKEISAFVTLYRPSVDLIHRYHPSVSYIDLRCRFHPSILSVDLICRFHMSISSVDLVRRSYPSILFVDLIRCLVRRFYPSISSVGFTCRSSSVDLAVSLHTSER